MRKLRKIQEGLHLTARQLHCIVKTAFTGIYEVYAGRQPCNPHQILTPNLQITYDEMNNDTNTLITGKRSKNMNIQSVHIET